MFPKHILVTAAGITTLFFVAKLAQPEKWPSVNFPKETSATVKKAIIAWRKSSVDYKPYLESYSATGDYLNYGQKGICEKNPNRLLDANGIAMREYNGRRFYHPIISAQCGLSAYGWFVRGHDGLPSVLRYTDHLISMQSEDGAFRYPFPYKYYLTGKEMPTGWTSGMAQGQALSLLARVFKLTRNSKYVEAGRKALKYLTTSTKNGGVMTTMADLDPSLSNYIFFEEYVSRPANYTLNGYMFALLGVYDWSKSDPDSEAGKYFNQGIETLVKILPYYDAGTLSAYDLDYMTFRRPAPNVSARYHAVHIYLLHAINSIVDNPTLKDFERNWTSNADSISATQ